MKKKYKVILGIFKGHEFEGIVSNNRVVDLFSHGRSYPIENCIVL